MLLALAARGVIDSGSGLVLSALFAGIGVGVVQMAMPGLIRQRFSRRSAAVTGLWAGALMGGGGLGAALSPWLKRGTLGVPLALSGWALPVLLAILLVASGRRVPAAPDAAAGNAAAAVA